MSKILSLLSAVFEFASGKKTYIAGISAIILGVYRNDETLIIEGLAIIGIGHKIEKAQSVKIVEVEKE